MSIAYSTLVLTPEFMESYARLAAAERRRFLQALLRLDADERHPSLRVYPLRGNREGLWSASASDSLRITFARLSDGPKRLFECSQHYGD